MIKVCTYKAMQSPKLAAFLSLITQPALWCPACRQVCTLADLDVYLAQQHKVASYNDLCMGPLLAHELVLANFRPPPHIVEIPQVSRPVN
jgi:hypothetical protein